MLRTGKIIKVDSETITVAKTGDNTLEKYDRSQFSFEPQLNDEVDIYTDEFDVIINKKESKLNIPQPNFSKEGLENDLKPHKVNKIIYLIVTFFLGGLGVHKFYAGKTVLGILYLVFCWTYIPSLIAFFEFLGALFKKEDINGDIYV